MVERMIKRHQPSYEPRHLHRFLHPLRIEKRALDEFLQHLEIPFVVIFREHDL